MHQRKFLVPWLVFQLFFLTGLLVSLFHTMWMNNFHMQLYQVLLALLSLAVFCCWKKIIRQFVEMAEPRWVSDTNRLSSGSPAFLLEAPK